MVINRERDSSCPSYISYTSGRIFLVRGIEMSEKDIRKEIEEFETYLSNCEKKLQVKEEKYLKALKNVSKPWVYLRFWKKSEDYAEYKCTHNVFLRFGKYVKDLKNDKNKLESLLSN